MNRPNRIFVLLIAIAGSLAAMIAFSLNHRRKGAARPPDEAASMAESTSNDGDLRPEIAALRAEVERLRWEAAAARVANAAAPTPVAPPKTPTPEEVAAEAARFYGKLSARAQEKKDTVWSDKTEGLIDHVISQAKTPGTKATSVRCGTSVCEVATVSDDLNAQSQLARILSTEEPFHSAGGTFFQYHEGATPTTTVYLLRPGAALDGS